MKKNLIIGLVVSIALVYLLTGRWQTVTDNVQRDGLRALTQEPKWLVTWCSDKGKSLRSSVDGMIDGRQASRAERLASVAK